MTNLIDCDTDYVSYSANNTKTMQLKIHNVFYYMDNFYIDIADGEKVRYY